MNLDEVRDRYTLPWYETADYDYAKECADFDRIIEQVRAETLRDARETLIADQIDFFGIVLPDVNIAVDMLADLADRIEKEAGL